MDRQHSCTPFVRCERRLTGQRARVRRGKRGRDARWIAQPTLVQDGEHLSSSLLIAAFSRPSAILERAKSGCFLSPSLTTWHSFRKVSAAVFVAAEKTHFAACTLGDIMFAEKKFWRENKTLPYDFLFFNEFFLFFFRFPWIQLLSLSPPCCALFTHAVSFSLITCAVVLVAGPIPLFFFKVMFSHLSIWVFFLCNRVQDKGICPYFGSAKKRQSSSQGSCWDPKKPSRMKHQKKKKENTTLSFAWSEIPLSL